VLPLIQWVSSCIASSMKSGSSYPCIFAQQRGKFSKAFCVYAGMALMAADWDDLRIFLAVARAESLSGAGRLLRIDPATVGRRIARMEEALGARLFAKSPQGYALTDDGARMLDHAVRAEQAVTAALEEVGSEPGRLTGQIRIGAPGRLRELPAAAGSGGDLRRESGAGGSDHRAAPRLQPVQARG
jgi:hypothetical protein